MIDGAQGYAIEPGGQKFRPSGVNRCRDGEHAHGFMEEGGLLALRLGECDRDLGAAERDWQAGKSCAGAVIEERSDAEGQSAGMV